MIYVILPFSSILKLAINNYSLDEYDKLFNNLHIHQGNIDNLICQEMKECHDTTSQFLLDLSFVSTLPSI